MKLSKKELAALSRIEREKAFHGDSLVLAKAYRKLESENEALIDVIEHCGYDPEDCIDCGGPPHNEHCRFWKIRYLSSYYESVMEGKGMSDG